MANVGAQVVNPLDPSSIVAQQQIARQQAMAQALREQSLQPIDYDHKGAISPWQGLAKAVQGLAGGYMQGGVDAKTLGLATQRQQALAAFVRGDAPQSSQPPAMPESTPALPDVAPVGATSVPPPTIAPQNPPASVGGSTGPTPVPPGPASPTAPAGMGPPSEYAQYTRPPPPAPHYLTGSQDGDMLFAQTDMGKYLETRATQNAPVDSARMVRQMQAAAASGDYETAAAIKGALDKANNIPLVSGRPGAPMYDHNGNIVQVSPQNIEGGNPVVQNGRFTGDYTPAGGAAGIIGNVNAAKSSGTEAGKVPFQTDTTFNPATGQMEITPRSKTLGGGYPTTAPMGAPAMANTMGDASGKYFSGLAESAADAPNRVYALNQMLPLLNNGTQFGPGTDTAVKFADFANGVGKALGIQSNLNPQNITNINEFNKWSAQYSARAAADLGLGGSDARLAMSVSATPNGHMTNDALKAIIPQMIGFEAAKQGMATAGQQFAQSHPGPNAQGQFLTQWRANYDPRIYQWMQGGPAMVAANVGKLPPPERVKLVQQYRALKGMGAIQ